MSGIADAPEPFARSNLVRRAPPYVAATAIGLLLMPAQAPSPLRIALVAAALACSFLLARASESMLTILGNTLLCAAIFAAAIVPIPLHRPSPAATAALAVLGAVIALVLAAEAGAPRWAHPLPILGGLAALFWLRQLWPADPLHALPLACLGIGWLASYHRTRELVAGLGVAAAALIYPAGSHNLDAQAGTGALCALFLVLFGAMLHDLVRRTRASGGVISVATGLMRSVVSMRRPHTARDEACQAMLEVAQATSVTLHEVGAGGGLYPAAHAGAPGSMLHYSSDGQAFKRAGDQVMLLKGGFAVAEAWKTGRSVFHANLNPEERAGYASAAPPRSVFCQPWISPSGPVGVFEIAWRRRRRHLPDHIRRAAALIADEAAMAIHHEDVVARLQGHALTDPLTMVPNRRAWEDELHRAMARSRRDRGELHIGLLDLDAFKQLNDTAGHQEGDRVLRAVTRAWRQELREGDFLARLGGDEFGVLITDCPAEVAAGILRRVTSATPDGLSSSAGMATWNRTESAAAIYRRADAALYSAKSAGGAQTVITAAN